MKTEKIEFKNSKGMKIVGLLHTPDEKTDKITIHCHGYRSVKESAKAITLSKIVPNKRIAFLHFDFSGRGESEGNFKDTTISQYIDDLKSAIDFVQNLGYKHIAVIGNSLGGLVSLQEIAKDNRAKVLILMSPVSYFPWRKEHQEEFAPEKVKEWKEKGETITKSNKSGDLIIGYQFYEDGLQYNDYSVYENIKIPVLILHGDKDESVALEFSEELIKHLENNKLIVVERANHNYSKKEDYDKVINETVKFLEENL